jgi:hypothetical protein
MKHTAPRSVGPMLPIRVSIDLASWLGSRLGCLSVIRLPQSFACQRSLVEVRPAIPVCILVGSVGLCVRAGLCGASDPWRSAATRRILRGLMVVQTSLVPSPRICAPERPFSSPELCHNQTDPLPSLTTPSDCHNQTGPLLAFPSGRLTSSNVATWVVSAQDSNTAPQTSQDTWPLCGIKHVGSMRLYSAPHSHRTSVVSILEICARNHPFSSVDNCHNQSSSGWASQTQRQ